MPFWDLVRDFAAQGLGMRKTARALGLSGRQMCRICQGRPEGSPFQSRKAWIGRVEAEYGMSLDEFLRTEAAAARFTGTSMVMLAEELGVHVQTLREAAWALGIRWPRCYSLRQQEANHSAARKS